MDSAESFRNICRRNNLNLSDRQIESLSQYVDLLRGWNEKINLISRKDSDNIWRRHILGSIALLFHFSFHSHSFILDLGTGGGLPGIPLGVVRDDLQITLVDSTQKKIRAVADMLSALHLSNVRAVAARAEEIGKNPEFHQKFDYVIARAVAPVTDILKWGKPFLAPRRSAAAAEHKNEIPRGSVVMLKGGDLAEEIARARLHAKGAAIDTYTVVVDGLDDVNDLYDKKIMIVQP